LNSFGLKLNPAKWNLFQNGITYLGHVISEDGIRTDPDKVMIDMCLRDPYYY